MTRYPVHYVVAHPPRFSRLQLVVRIVAFIAFGVLGLSLGTIFFFAYLALPVFAASRLAASDRAARYVDGDGPRVLRALHWFAAVSAWAGLVVEYLPGRSPEETVEIVVEGRPQPTAASAMWRVLTGIPSALVLALLAWVGALVWLWAALTVLLFERVGPHTFGFLAGLQRWSIRLLVYQAALVDEYPPFGFSDTLPDRMPVAAAS